MQITITAQNIDINDEHKEYVEATLAGLEKAAGNFADESASIQVEIKKNGDKDYHDQVELHGQVHLAGTNISTEVLAGSVNEAADLAYDKLRAQIAKYKDKNQASHEKADIEAITEDAADLYDIDPEEAK